MGEISKQQELRVASLENAVRIATATEQDWTKDEILDLAEDFYRYITMGRAGRH